MKRSAQRAEGEIVSARDRGENRPALHWGHVKVNVFMQMSQSGEIVSKSTFVCAQKVQRGPKGVFFFFSRSWSRLLWVCQSRFQRQRTLESSFQSHETQSSVYRIVEMCLPLELCVTAQGKKNKIIEQKKNYITFIQYLHGPPQTYQFKKVISQYAFSSSSHSKQQRPTNNGENTAKKTKNKLQTDK